MHRKGLRFENEAASFCWQCASGKISLQKKLGRWAPIRPLQSNKTISWRPCLGDGLTLPLDLCRCNIVPDPSLMRKRMILNLWSGLSLSSDISARIQCSTEQGTKCSLSQWSQSECRAVNCWINTQERRGLQGLHFVWLNGRWKVKYIKIYNLPFLPSEGKYKKGRKMRQ